MGLAACLIAFIVSINHLNQLDNETDRTALATKVGTEIIYYFTNARIFELDYIYAKSNTSNSDHTREQITIVNEKIAELDALTNNENVTGYIEQLTSLSTTYITMFDEMVEINDQIGTPFAGSISNLNSSRINLQTSFNLMLSLIDDTTFQRNFMTLLTNENEFVMLPNQTFLNRYEIQLERLHSDLNQLDVSDSMKSSFREALNIYNENLESLAKLFFSQQELSSAFSNLIVEIQDVAANIELELNNDFITIQDEKNRFTQLIFVYLTSIGGIILIILVLTSFFLNRSINQSVSRILNGTKVIGDGDLTYRVDASSKDEMGQLAGAFNQMAENVQQSFSVVNDVSDRLLASSVGLSTTSESTLKQTQEVSIAIDQIASGAGTQAVDIEHSTQHLSAMMDRLEDVNQSAQNINGQVGQSLSTGKTVLQAANDLGETSVQFLKLARGLVKNVDEVTNHSNQIASIVETIEHLSDSTNLLALNASIEAARAGEHGRGFAVVANEVKVLAERSKEEAKYIHQVISEMNTKMNELVNGAKSLDNYSEKQKNVVDKTVISIEENINQIEMIKSFTDQIYVALENLNTSSKEVGDKIHNVSATSEEFAATSEEVSASSEEQISAIMKVSEASKVLNELARALTEEMEKFILQKEDDNETFIKAKATAVGGIEDEVDDDKLTKSSNNEDEHNSDSSWDDLNEPPSSSDSEKRS